VSENSSRLGMPYIQQGQAQKHVTHNEAIEVLDLLVQLTVEAFDATQPPAVPAEGEVWALGHSPVEAWTGHAGDLAAWSNGGWLFITPKLGWRAAKGADIRVWTGDAWIAPLAGNIENLVGLGINAEHDEENRLVLSANASLFSHDGADHRLKINKASAPQTATLLFQSGFSGRAEMGLAGDDDFSVKVSTDGNNWREAIKVDRASGRARVNGMRETLFANRTYYVRKDGDDLNSGRSDDSDGAFLTIGRAIEEAYGRLDLGPNDVTIQVRPGVYEELVYIPAPSVGAGSVKLCGVASDPGAVVVRLTNMVSGLPVTLGGVVHVWNGAFLRVANLKIERTGGPTLPAMDVRFGGHVLVEPGSEIIFGATSTAAVRLISGFFSSASATIRHVGDAPALIQCAGGNANLNAATLHLAGRSYSNAVFQATRAGILTNASGAFSMTGPASGNRVMIRSNGVIDFGSVPLSSIPGTSDGPIDTGGVYLPVP
jgi:hypothetical protein